MGLEWLLAGVVVFFVWKRFVRPRFSKHCENFILSYRYPKRIRERVKQQYPHLNETQVNRVMRGLREYFILCGMAGNRMVAMPSQVVDVAWHEFILFTRDYANFCQKGMGKFLHHTPTEAMKTRTLATDGIKRAWRLACAREKIDPKTPAKLPLLFALDAELAIPDGFSYVLDCSAVSANRGDFCGSHIGCSSGCSGGSGYDGADFGSASSDSGGDGGGCGGGGD